MNPELLSLGHDTVAYRFGGETNSYLLVRGRRAILVDCGDAGMPDQLKQAGLPTPDMILHTHVQEEHCREGKVWAGARILVPRGTTELASDADAFTRRSRTTWDDPAAWPVTLGAEPYGIAGAVTARPPGVPLAVAGELSEGDTVAWQGLTLRIIALPGHTAEAIGLVVGCEGQTLACLTGDLLAAPGTLVNVYDLEYAYGRTRLPDLPAVLRGLASNVETDLYLPSTGPVLRDGRAAARKLADAIDTYLVELEWRPPDEPPREVPAQGGAGRFECVAEGIYQFQIPGNCIVLIAPNGAGLMIDPGPCDYENPDRVAAFMADVEALEREAGLRRIERILMTHMHGDHYDMAPHVLARYPGCRVAAWAPLARLIENPRAYPYACLLPWYNVGWETLRVDDHLHRGEPYPWQGVPIRTVHLPGHCLLHAAYLLRWGGLQLAITGDTVQSRGRAVGLDFTICNYSAPDAAHGIPGAMETLAGLDTPIDLNLGGHGSRFTDCHAMYKGSVARIRHALPYLQALIPGGDIPSAFIRKGYPRFED